MKRTFRVTFISRRGSNLREGAIEFHFEPSLPLRRRATNVTNASLKSSIQYSTPATNFICYKPSERASKETAAVLVSCSWNYGPPCKLVIYMLSQQLAQFKKTIQYNNRTNHFFSVRRVCQLMSYESEKFKFSMCLVHIAVNARNKINKQFKNVLIIKLIHVQLLVTVRPTSLSTV